MKWYQGEGWDGRDAAAPMVSVIAPPPVAALYVASGGCYYNQPGVDPWDAQRDARTYAGPHPVVAHPPCERWGNFWWSARHKGKGLGDDDGCFAAALAAVESWGGVLEHPRSSRAWKHFGIEAPPLVGGWVRARNGWTCCVAQRNYGHRAQKYTWLYAVGCDLPELVWGPGPLRAVSVELMGKRERAATPPAFRDVLVAMARSVTP